MENRDDPSISQSVFEIRLLTLAFDLINQGRVKAAQDLLSSCRERGYISDETNKRLQGEVRDYYRQRKANKKGQ